MLVPCVRSAVTRAAKRQRINEEGSGASSVHDYCSDNVDDDGSDDVDEGGFDVDEEVVGYQPHGRDGGECEVAALYTPDGRVVVIQSDKSVMGDEEDEPDAAQFDNEEDTEDEPYAAHSVTA